MTREEYLARKRAYSAKYRAKYGKAHRSATTLEQRQRHRAAYAAKDGVAAHRAAYMRKLRARIKREGASRLLRELYARTPAYLQKSTRDDMAAQAYLMTLEGASLDEAVTAARRSVNAGEYENRYAVPIDDAFWL